MIARQHRVYNIIIIFAIIGLTAPLFSFAAGTINVPVSTDAIKNIWQKVTEDSGGGIMEKIKNFWNNEILPVLKKIYNWLKANVWPKIKPLYDKLLKPEVDKRKPGIGLEAEKEKQEMTQSAKQDLPKAFESLWTKIKTLLKI